MYTLSLLLRQPIFIPCLYSSFDPSFSCQPTGVKCGSCSTGSRDSVASVRISLPSNSAVGGNINELECQYRSGWEVNGYGPEWVRSGVLRCRECDGVGSVPASNDSIVTHDLDSLTEYSGGKDIECDSNRCSSHTGC